LSDIGLGTTIRRGSQIEIEGTYMFFLTSDALLYHLIRIFGNKKKRTVDVGNIHYDGKDGDDCNCRSLREI